MHRSLRALLLALALLSSGARPARAALLFHAALLRSEPPADTTLGAAPERIRLLFSERIEASLCTVALVGEDGRVTRLTTRADPADPRALLAAPGTLAPGAWRVEWHAVAADGHPSHGTFVFRIAAPATPAAAVAPPGSTAAPPMAPGAMGPQAPAGLTLAGAPLVSVVARGIAIGVLMAFAGLLAFLGWGAKEPVARAQHAATWLAVAAPIVLAADAVTWVAQAAPAGIGAALATGPGRVELWRTGLALLASLALAAGRRVRLAAVLALLAVAVSGAAGHPLAIHPALAVPAKALHLLAGAIWLGGLSWLVLAWRRDDAFVVEAHRVSGAALASVIVVAASGIVQALLFLPTPRALIESTYGSLVLAKSAGLVVLVIFGAWHRYRALPVLTAAERGQRMQDAARRLRGSVRWEIAVMVLVILLGALLASVSPPHVG